MKAPDTIYIAPDSHELMYQRSWFQSRHSDSDVAYVRLQAHADRYLPAIVSLERTVEAHKAEIDDLRDLLSSTSLEAGAEIARLIKALNRYGEHSPECSRFGPGAAGDECTCGFTAALKGE